MLTLGVDIGSLTGKALILEGDEIKAWEIILTGPDSIETAQSVTQKTLDKAGVTLDDLDYIVSTGYGRIVVPFAQKNVSEISCHGRGAHFLFSGARTILDMGGQDCKAIRLDADGRVADFAMNDKCAAGAGRSMGIVANLVGCQLEEIGELSMQAEGDGVAVSSVCVVFARSEILTHLRNGVARSEVLAGACTSLCNRVYGLLRRVGIEEQFVISGGIAKNRGVVTRLERKLGLEAHIAFEPQILGALGAAVFARDLATKKARRKNRRQRRRRVNA